ncbi:hypothetical protein KI387_030142, partial [Taxus chinensis]
RPSGPSSGETGATKSWTQGTTIGGTVQQQQPGKRPAAACYRAPEVGTVSLVSTSLSSLRWRYYERCPSAECQMCLDRGEEEAEQKRVRREEPRVEGSYWERERSGVGEPPAEGARAR